jgi:hypothetical protein
MVQNNHLILSNKAITNVIKSFYSRNNVNKLIYYSSKNNLISKLNKDNIIDYLNNSKYKIIFENFEYYDYEEMTLYKPPYKLYNVVLHLKNNKDLDLIFLMINENKNKWRFENLYFNNI